LAKTESEVEFYLVEVRPESGAHAEEVEELLRGTIRKGDAVFSFEGHLYVALSGDVRGAGHATRRILRLIRGSALPVRTRLVEEPFPENLSLVAHRVVSGEIRISQRPPRQEKKIRHV
jgi:hypothetical protein